MQELSLEKIETSLGTITVASNPPSVEIFDESIIPAEYIKEKVTTQIDKTAIKNAIKEGKRVAGATLVENKKSLRIK